MEAAFQYTSEFHENIMGFCNNIYNSEGGAHLTGFKTAFTTIINSYARDVLDEKYAVTNWDQGKMSMGMLEQILKTLVTEYDVIGVDICGMYPEENSLPEYLRAERVNIRSDEELYRFLQKNLFCWASHK